MTKSRRENEAGVKRTREFNRVLNSAGRVRAAQHALPDRRRSVGRESKALSQVQCGVLNMKYGTGCVQVVCTHAALLDGGDAEKTMFTVGSERDRDFMGVLKHGGVAIEQQART